MAREFSKKTYKCSRTIDIKSFRKNKGNALLMFIPLIFFLLTFGYALIFRTSADHTQSFRLHRQNAAMYLAEGALKISMEHINRNLNGTLKKKLIDSSASTIFYLDKEFPDLKKNVDSLIAEMPGAQLTRLTASVKDSRKFSGSILSDKNSKEKQFTLVFTCEVLYLDITEKLTITRDLKIVNIEPPAREFTLYTNHAPADPYELNKGPYISCFNEDDNSKLVGKIRLKGKNIINLGNYDGSFADIIDLKNLMPFAQLGRLPKVFEIALEAAAAMLPIDPAIANAIKASNVKNLSYALKLPKNAAGVEKPEEDSKSRRTARVSLVGTYLEKDEKNEGIKYPEKLFGDVKKRYGYRSLEVVLSPASAAGGVPVYKLELGELTEVICGYKFGQKDAISPLSILLPDLAATIDMPDTNHYKQRAMFFKENITMKSMKAFETGDAFYANGIIFTNHAEIGSETQPFKYNGKFIIASSSTMEIKHDVKVKTEGTSPIAGVELKKIKSNLGLILTSNNLPNPIYFARQKSDTFLKVEANVFSNNGIKPTAQNIIIDPADDSVQHDSHDPAVSRCISFYGNLAVNKLNPKTFFAYIKIYFRDRLASKDDLEQYVINMSPIYSSWYEDGAKQ